MSEPNNDNDNDNSPTDNENPDNTPLATSTDNENPAMTTTVDDMENNAPTNNTKTLSDDDKARVLKQAVGNCSFCMLLFMATAAFALGIASCGMCGFVNRELTLQPNTTREEFCTNFTTANPEVNQDQCLTFFHHKGVGLWQWEGTIPVNQRVCFSYTIYLWNEGYVSASIDTKLNAARGFSIVANLFGMFGFVVLVLASCCPLSKERLSGLSCSYFMASLFQGLVLIIFASAACSKGFFADFWQAFVLDTMDDPVESVHCSLARGSNMAIAATVLYFMSMILAPFATPPSPIIGGGDIQRGSRSRQEWTGPYVPSVQELHRQRETPTDTGM